MPSDKADLRRLVDSLRQVADGPQQELIERLLESGKSQSTVPPRLASVLSTLKAKDKSASEGATIERLIADLEDFDRDNQKRLAEILGLKEAVAHETQTETEEQSVTEWYSSTQGIRDIEPL